MFNRKRSKWLSLFIIVAALVSMLVQGGMASAATQLPVINPNGGAFTAARTVTISNIAYGDTAYYTADTSNPTTSSTATHYTGAFTVSQSETVRAAVYDSITGWSAVASAVFSISGASLQTPVIYPSGGAFTAARSVTIGSIPYGYTAYYTTDGSDPTTSSTSTPYTGAFTVAQSETVQAAVHGSSGWSAVASAVFSISGASLQTPVIYPSGGAFTAAQSVTIGGVDSGDTIYYTTDGSDPTTSSTATPYTGAFTVSQSETVQAAAHDSVSGWSAVTSAAFIINGQPGSNSDQIAQLKQEFAAAINSDRMAQAMQILQQIQQLVKQGSSESQLNNLKQQLIDAVNNEKWAKAEEILKQIIKIENSGWAYTQLGQVYQQQGDNNINVFSNGDQVNFDVQPIIVNGRTLIPIRQAAKAFGLSDSNVDWDSKGTVTINNGSSRIIIRNNAQQVSLNGASYDTDVPAQIVNGRMMVPLRAIGQLFHKNVQWYPNGKIVSIS